MIVINWLSSPSPSPSLFLFFPPPFASASLICCCAILYASFTRSCISSTASSGASYASSFF